MVSTHVTTQVSPQLLGLALSNIINLMGTLQWAVRQSAETENCMTSPERLLEFAQLEQARQIISDATTLSTDRERHFVATRHAER